MTEAVIRGVVKIIEYRNEDNWNGFCSGNWINIKWWWDIEGHIHNRRTEQNRTEQNNNHCCTSSHSNTASNINWNRSDRHSNLCSDTHTHSISHTTRLCKPFCRYGQCIIISLVFVFLKCYHFSLLCFTFCSSIYLNLFLCLWLFPCTAPFCLFSFTF